MCNFFSLVTTDRHAIYYFNCKQRKDMLLDRRGNLFKPDSHASICSYYGLDEDAVNKYEWNPFTNKLHLDTKQFDEDASYILDHLNTQDWTPICGDLEGARKFIEGLSDIPWLKPDPDYEIPSGVKMFEDYDAAYEAAHDAARLGTWNAARVTTRADFWDAAYDTAHAAAWDVAWDAARVVAYDAACIAAYGVVRNVTRGAARDAARDIAYDAAYDASLDAAQYCASVYVLAGVEMPPHHAEYIRTRFELWRHGYGVVCDVDGVLYCYRNIILQRDDSLE